MMNCTRRKVGAPGAGIAGAGRWRRGSAGVSRVHESNKEPGFLPISLLEPYPIAFPASRRGRVRFDGTDNVRRITYHNPDVTSVEDKQITQTQSLPGLSF
jgi:hypothetical protein